MGNEKARWQMLTGLTVVLMAWIVFEGIPTFINAVIIPR
jgi:hypothetical protein